MSKIFNLSKGMIRIYVCCGSCANRCFDRGGQPVCKFGYLKGGRDCDKYKMKDKCKEYGTSRNYGSIKKKEYFEWITDYRCKEASRIKNKEIKKPASSLLLRKMWEKEHGPCYVWKYEPIK